MTPVMSFTLDDGRRRLAPGKLRARVGVNEAWFLQSPLNPWRVPYAFAHVEDRRDGTRETLEVEWFREVRRGVYELSGQGRRWLIELWGF